MAVLLQQGRVRYLALAGLLGILVFYLTLYHNLDGGSPLEAQNPSKGAKGGIGGSTTTDGAAPPPQPPPSEQSHAPPPKPWHRPDGHPISKLIDEAQMQFTERLGKRSTTLEQAAYRYRERRGRHPPPGFDKWFEAAAASDAVIVEDFFDRIHDDINPFWAMDPLEMRRQAHLQPQVIRVRNGNTTFVTDNPHRPEYIQLWHALLAEMQEFLPDLDMVVNVMDETRILVPWEDMAEHIAKEEKSRSLFSPDLALTEYTDYRQVDEAADEKPYDVKWIKGKERKYWDYLVKACPPDSPARKYASLASFDSPIDDVYPTGPLPYMYQGFVQNWTLAQDPCQQPHLRGMHGTFVESLSMSTSQKLFPMFGGSKLPQNNELLVPGAMYLTKRVFYHGGDDHGGPWEEKRNGLIWRGVASGGRNHADTWWHFQRHRWVQMMNGTTVGLVANGDAAAGPTFTLDGANSYNVKARYSGGLGPWISSFADAGFVDLECFPQAQDAEGRRLPSCPHTDPYFPIQESIDMKTMYEYKFLPDVDGNSFSGRWRGFLMSTSMPLKSTIYTEWHDDRLAPWVHFAPFDQTYMDIYAVMEYFLDGRDDAARRIAEEGKEWADRVLRREDMRLYVWRLLLEYARVVDPKRDRLGFVADLTTAKSL
ncbi:hypothetical protein E8E14_014105 [Neopestalotiopsis sp. 37M]|nr:hypothetical protein E8E14_014105 [Neopestalotiopsis sp. 37M]